ncbi:hypothetical protein ASPSYDRAFT_41790 [Aspergillus sydowii CBS 593.65]|uniref:Uncharacterized protein n=1 Tax=Aspergillus sydowii CBS 593.65 TaxID=1036612 RepID=A0A1L9TUG6_9EURO|nr:uncharacterized protein ASPSYDRAFT_41790 [Aspergillus sydowii CBS 593.65]OJJ63074.1 hypothetical protein ASPSYDRAFT_41790 [Aspergillus sydowii CBS 593.65]
MSAPTLAVGFTGSHCQSTTPRPRPSPHHHRNGSFQTASPQDSTIPVIIHTPPTPNNAHARSAHRQVPSSVAEDRGCCRRCSFVCFTAN